MEKLRDILPQNVGLETQIRDIFEILERIKTEINEAQKNHEAYIRSSPFLVACPHIARKRKLMKLKHGNISHAIEIVDQTLVLTTVVRDMIAGLLERAKTTEVIQINKSGFSFDIIDEERSFNPFRKGTKKVHHQGQIDHRDPIKMPAKPEVHKSTLDKLLTAFLVEIMQVCEIEGIKTEEAPQALRIQQS